MNAYLQSALDARSLLYGFACAAVIVLLVGVPLLWRNCTRMWRLK